MKIFKAKTIMLWPFLGSMVQYVYRWYVETVASIRREYWKSCRIKEHIIEEKSELLFGGMLNLLKV